LQKNNFMEEKSKTKQQRSVVHLYLKEKDEHIYFGSVANIFEFFTKEDIGISFGSLRNYVLSPNKPYENKLVIIRKGLLRAKPKATKDTLNKDIIDSGIEVTGAENCTT